MRLLRLFKRDIAHESRSWVEKGLISEQQAQSICNEYEVDYDHQNDKIHGHSILITLGNIFIGLAVITLIGENWNDIPRALRMWGLILLTILIHGTGCLAYHEGNQSKAKRLFFIGNFG